MMRSNFNTYELKLRDDEHLISVMRKHWFVLFLRVMPFKVLFALPLIALFFIPSVNPDAYISLALFFGSLWMLVLLMVIFTLWTTYYLDIWIVTNQRIMDIEQKTLFNREVKTLRMETVQDVQIDIVGLFQEFLNFGTLRVQTAGTGGTDAKIVGIPNPASERNLIMNQVHAINVKAHASGKKVASKVLPHAL